MAASRQAAVFLVTLWMLPCTASAAEDGICSFGSDCSDTSTLLQASSQIKAHGGTLTSHIGAYSDFPLLSDAYYINLDQARDRRENLETQLLHLQNATSNITRFGFHRVPGLDKKDPLVIGEAKERYNCKTRCYLDEGSRVGNYACFASHMRAWRQVWDEEARLNKSSLFALILEDDAQFKIDNLSVLTYHLANVPSDADIVVLGIFGNVRPRDLVAPGVYRATGPFSLPFNMLSDYDYQLAMLANSSSDTRVRNQANVFYGGLHAYLIRVSRLPELIALYESKASTVFSIEKTVDALLDPAIRKYVISPNLVEQNHSFVALRTSDEGKRIAEQRRLKKA